MRLCSFAWQVPDLASTDTRHRPTHCFAAIAGETAMTTVMQLTQKITRPHLAQALPEMPWSRAGGMSRPRLFKGVAVISQKRQRNQENADQRLKARETSHPTCSSQSVFVRIKPTNPGSDIYLVPANMKGGDDTEVERILDDIAVGGVELNGIVPADFLANTPPVPYTPKTCRLAGTNDHNCVYACKGKDEKHHQPQRPERRQPPVARQLKKDVAQEAFNFTDLQSLLMH